MFQKACPAASILLRNLSAENTNLKSVLQEKIPKEQERVREFRKKHGSTKVGEVTVDMVTLHAYFIHSRLRSITAKGLFPVLE